MELQNLVDAFGNPIEFGNWYALSTSKSGLTRIVVGVAIRATSKSKLVLKVKSVVEFVGDERVPVKDLINVSVNPHVCFRVQHTNSKYTEQID